ncbi:hypothetical protein CYY_005698 [Polysphondylium violaceum]|uniref:Uncharacterized protein n=1 Tax=Polysphondylium violaceum TaxID=133409 RepID=A0A8J4Q2K0_9MYCE|nr:hypothetical protein CYY_005698 [Polysphondylium violaceum]
MGDIRIIVSLVIYICVCVAAGQYISFEEYSKKSSYCTHYPDECLEQYNNYIHQSKQSVDKKNNDNRDKEEKTLFTSTNTHTRAVTSEPVFYILLLLVCLACFLATFIVESKRWKEKRKSNENQVNNSIERIDNNVSEMCIDFYRQGIDKLIENNNQYGLDHWLQIIQKDKRIHHNSNSKAIISETQYLINTFSTIETLNDRFFEYKQGILDQDNIKDLKNSLYDFIQQQSNSGNNSSSSNDNKSIIENKYLKKQIKEIETYYNQLDKEDQYINAITRVIKYLTRSSNKSKSHDKIIEQCNSDNDSSGEHQDEIVDKDSDTNSDIDNNIDNDLNLVSDINIELLSNPQMNVLLKEYQIVTNNFINQDNSSNSSTYNDDDDDNQKNNLINKQKLKIILTHIKEMKKDQRLSLELIEKERRHRENYSFKIQKKRDKDIEKAKEMEVKLADIRISLEKQRLEAIESAYIKESAFRSIIIKLLLSLYLMIEVFNVMRMHLNAIIPSIRCANLGSFKLLGFSLVSSDYFPAIVSSICIPVSINIQYKLIFSTLSYILILLLLINIQDIKIFGYLGIIGCVVIAYFTYTVQVGALIPYTLLFAFNIISIYIWQKLSYKKIQLQFPNDNNTNTKQKQQLDQTKKTLYIIISIMCVSNALISLYFIYYNIHIIIPK